MARGLSYYWNKQRDNIFEPFDKLAANMLSGQIDAVREATLLIHETAVKSLQENSDGTPQIRYNPKRVVAVSKPGDPPNTDTGRAVQSIKVEFEKKGFWGRVGTNLKYLRMLEFGTEHIAPRPWLSAAVSDVADKVAEIFARNVKKSVKDSTK